jgi:hypothetical protein
VLIRVLDRGPFEQQGNAAEALGDIGPAAREALPALRRRLALPDKSIDTGPFVSDFVARYAAEAIKAIETPTDDGAQAP